MGRPSYSHACKLLILFIFGVAGLLPFSCRSRGGRVHVSLSGDYAAFLEIGRDQEGHGVWVVNIEGPDGGTLLAETMPGHPASLMAYLAWDDSDRLWWYGSDDGSVFFWERTDTGWARHDYRPEGGEAVVPPDSLFTQGNGRRSQ